MQLRSRSAGFVRTEGGLLPPDLLERVRALDRKLPGLDEAAYGLAKGERFGEAITRSWNELVGQWGRLQEDLAKVPPSDPGTTTTRERFLLPLMEALGYGRLTPVKAIELEGKAYPVSHTFGDVPLHLVGAHITLDARTRGVAGAAGQSPHGLLQELLNRSPERLWGIVTNGLTLRILRDNASLTRQAYVEFDLEAIFTGEAYADFALLWHLAHRSRLEPRVPDKADEAPSRARCLLPGGVEQDRRGDRCPGPGPAARRRSGRHRGARPRLPRPSATTRSSRQPSQSEDLKTQDYYRELLRLVYRLILLFVAEDRDLLLDPKASAGARDRYARYYSTARLRRLAERRKGSRHADLYAGLRLVIEALGRDDGAPGIGLPPLGGFLFGPDACPHLDRAQLANADLLDAIRELATIEERRCPPGRRLPQPRLRGARLDLRVPPRAAPRARRRRRRRSPWARRPATSARRPAPTTRRSRLISVLLDSALDPVLDEIADKPTKEEAERAILELSVVDPAAARATSSSRPRTGSPGAWPRSAPADEEPAPEAIAHRPARRHRPLPLRRRHQPDGGRAVQGEPLARGPRTGQAPDLPRRPHQVRQQPARHHPRARRQRASRTRRIRR